MPIPAQPPQKPSKPTPSNSSTPAPRQGEEWFEDALIGALKAHNQRQPQVL